MIKLNAQRNTKRCVTLPKGYKPQNPSNSILFTIPAEYAREYHLSEPTNVLIIPTDEGLLLKRLQVDKKND